MLPLHRQRRDDLQAQLQTAQSSQSSMSADMAGMRAELEEAQRRVGGLSSVTLSRLARA